MSANASILCKNQDTIKAVKVLAHFIVTFDIMKIVKMDPDCLYSFQQEISVFGFYDKSLSRDVWYHHQLYTNEVLRQTAIIYVFWDYQ